MVGNLKYVWRILQESWGWLTVLGLCILAEVLLPIFRIPARIAGPLSHLVQITLILSVVMVFFKASRVGRSFLYDIFDTSAVDNIRQRRLRTQIDYLYRIVLIVVFIAGLASVLLTFEGARKIGASLLASAGVASVVLGFAAQKSLSNLIAGFQIAFTQPMRLDDVVIVEKEWGRIEEITLTYVVVRIWDDRRLVLPITYFLEKPFENWTRQSADLLVPFFIYVDYRSPIEPIRKELERITRESPLWDKRVCILQVTNFSETTMELRALVSARNAPDAFDLKCFIRERLVAFIQSELPSALPRIRREVLVESELSGTALAQGDCRVGH